MNVLVCGSSGCVGRAVVHALRTRGHRVVETSHARRSEPSASDATLLLDFMQPVSPGAWARLLCELGIDTVVNCVGVLIDAPGARFSRVHSDGPAELFSGAAEGRLARVVQVSALGVGRDEPAELETGYLRSKRLADETLLALPIDAAIVRPALVYGPQSASARLFATLASFPLVALPGGGRQRLQPVHVFELAECVARLVEDRRPVRGIYEIAGGSVLDYRGMLAGYRDVLGLIAPLWLTVPMWTMRLSARIAERLPQRVFTRDTLLLLARGNTTAANAAPALLGRAPSTFDQGLAVTGAEPVLDLRVVLGGPVDVALRTALAFLWLQTALVSALLPHGSGVLDLLASCGFAGNAGVVVLALSCLLNAGLGIASLAWPSARLFAAQIAAIVGYTVVAAWNVPALTVDHCGPLAKNVPLLACVALLWLARSNQPARVAHANDHGSAVRSPDRALARIVVPQHSKTLKRA